LQRAINAGLAGYVVLYKLDKTRTIYEILSSIISGDKNKDYFFHFKLIIVLNVWSLAYDLYIYIGIV